MALQFDVPRPLRRFLVSAGAVAMLAVVAAPVARAQALTPTSAELIPAIGISRSVHPNEASSQMFGALGLRATILPMIKGEVRGAYRDERVANGDLHMRQWPITASLWFSPISMLYAGGGVGWYHTSFAYSDRLPFSNRTTDRFGAHLGGGVELPTMVPHLGFDVNGRYVFVKKQNQPLLDESSRPDFWNVTAGLAIHL